MTFSNADHPSDNRYFGKCNKCFREYAGPKRSLLCFTCTNPHLVLGWEGTGKPVTALDVIYRKGLILKELKK